METNGWFQPAKANVRAGKYGNTSHPNKTSGVANPGELLGAVAVSKVNLTARSQQEGEQSNKWDKFSISQRTRRCPSSACHYFPCGHADRSPSEHSAQHGVKKLNPHLGNPAAAQDHLLHSEGTAQVSGHIHRPAFFALELQSSAGRRWAVLPPLISHPHTGVTQALGLADDLLFIFS